MRSAMSNRSYPPTALSSLSTRRRQTFRPLSYHGMPKTPTSPSEGSMRAHRIPATRPLRSPPLSPMSPPMSAKSFGTFIDSEPSTPAYSPHAGYSNWDSSTLLILSPASTAPSSIPESPLEPVWEMMTPMKKSKRASSHFRKLSSHTRNISISSVAAKSIREESQKENALPAYGNSHGDHEAKSQAAPLHNAPLGKLATRMKSILRRKNSGEAKTEKKRRGYADLDRMETVHWTEM